MPTRKYTFNVILDNIDTQHLAQLASRYKTSRGATVRRLIDAAHRHELLDLPTCADGTRCFVPSMHVRPPAPEPQPTTS